MVTEPHTRARDNNFNLMRLILALLVIVSHSAELVDGDRSQEPLTRVFHTLSLGDVAVDGFFLLSGYLIIQSWERSKRAWPFLKKRILRIYPGFIAAALICALVVGPLGAPDTYFEQFHFGRFIRSVLLLHSPSIPAVFVGQPFPSVNGSMWTIQYEFDCYIAVLLLGITGIASRRSNWLALLCLLLVVASTKALFMMPHEPTYVDIVVRFAVIFSIGVCYYLYEDIIVHSRTLLLASSVLAVAGLLYAPVAELMCAIFGGYVLLRFALTPSPRLSWFNRLPDVSYGVYLYAWPIQKVMLQAWPALSAWELALLASVFSLIVGAASWYVVEQPFLRLKYR